MYRSYCIKSLSDPVVALKMNVVQAVAGRVRMLKNWQLRKTRVAGFHCSNKIYPETIWFGISSSVLLPGF
jgi:hypothetical protein